MPSLFTFSFHSLANAFQPKEFTIKSGKKHPLHFQFIVCAFLVFSLTPFPTDRYLMFNFIIWDVGQGSWATLIHQHQCLHFDAGGEKWPLKDILQLCQGRENKVFITHDDWDHVNGFRSLKRNIPHLCLYFPKKSKRNFLKNIKPCALPSFIEVISLGHSSGSKNADSIIYLLAKKILITGDAPISEEKKWLRFLNSKIEGLVLGHHGSATSTSMQLLKKIRPRWAAASARKAKYGHPHFKVLRKLQKQKVPVYRTETLGHLYFQIQF